MFKPLLHSLWKAAHYEALSPLAKQPLQIRAHARAFIAEARLQAAVARQRSYRILPGRERERTALLAGVNVLEIRLDALEESLKPLTRSHR